MTRSGVYDMTDETIFSMVSVTSQIYDVVVLQAVGCSAGNHPPGEMAHRLHHYMSNVFSSVSLVFGIQTQRGKEIDRVPGILDRFRTSLLT